MCSLRPVCTRDNVLSTTSWDFNGWMYDRNKHNFMQIICWSDGQFEPGLISVHCWRLMLFHAVLAPLPFPLSSDFIPNSFHEVCQSGPRWCTCKRSFVHLFLLDSSPDANAMKILLMLCCVTVLSKHALWSAWWGSAASWLPRWCWLLLIPTHYRGAEKQLRICCWENFSISSLEPNENG